MVDKGNDVASYWHAVLFKLWSGQQVTDDNNDNNGGDDNGNRQFMIEFVEWTKEAETKKEKVKGKQREESSVNVKVNVFVSRVTSATKCIVSTPICQR